MQSKRRVTWHLLGKNALIGVGIALLTHLLFPPQNPITKQLGNLASDVLLRIGAFDKHRDPHSLLRPLVFVDIDNDTHREWGEERPTPRRPLAQLLTILLAQKPALVFIDLDLSWTHAPDSALLRAVIENELKRSKDEERYSRLLLARPLVIEKERGRTAQQWLRPLFFESEARLAPDLLERQLTGTVTYNVDNDGVVRRWHLLETGCRDGVGQAAPSIQLLIAAYLASAVSQLEDWRAGVAQGACKSGEVVYEAPPLRVTEKLAFSSSDFAEPNRMLMRFDWERPFAEGETLLHAGQPVPLLRTISAAEVLRPRSTPTIARDLQDAIVVVGATHYDSADRHMTPKGELPGSFLVLNSIYSLLERGPMSAASEHIEFAAEMLLIVLLTMVFTYFSAGLSVFVGLILGLLLLFACAILLFYLGFWFDYFTPLLAVFLHQWYRNTEDRHELDALRKHKKHAATT